MEDLEITSLPLSGRGTLATLRTLGFTAHGAASQVSLADLVTQTIPAASIDYRTGTFIAQTPFAAGSSEVFVNGLRNTLGSDYKELTDGTTAKGFVIPGIDDGDEIVLRASFQAL